MTKVRLALGLIAVASTLSIYVAPASAEFTSNNKLSEGGNNNFHFVLEGVGATISCGAGESGFKWQIKNGGTPGEKGLLLTLKFKTWGECLDEYKEGGESKEGKVSGGECEIQTSEPKTEALVASTVVTTCTLKAEVGKKETCEIKIEPSGNKERQKITLIDSGEKDENLEMNLALKNITTSSTGAACEAAGIKSTTTATLTGDAEAREVTPAVLVPVFRMSYTGSPNIIGVGGRRTVSVTNTGTAGAPGARLLEAGNAPWFTVFGETLATCKAGSLNTNQSCSMKVEFSMASVNIKWVSFQIWEGGIVTSEVTIRGIS